MVKVIVTVTGNLWKRSGQRSPSAGNLILPNLKVFVRWLEESKGLPGYVTDLSMMHRLIVKGPRNAGEGMRLRSLKAKYRKEYGEQRPRLRGRGSYCRSGSQTLFLAVVHGDSGRALAGVSPG